MADAVRRIHYVIEDAQIGCAKVRVIAVRCSECHSDFHIDCTPEFCPSCGVRFLTEAPFLDS